jgi:hypothetical protein
MLQGGFRFDAKNDGTAKRALSVSLAKNTTTFHRLPNGNIGLTEWYPEAKTRSGNGGKDQARQAAKEVDEDDEDDGYYQSNFAEEVAKLAGDGKESILLNSKGENGSTEVPLKG